HTARPRPARDRPAGCGSGSAASCRPRGRGPRGRCRAAPGTWRSGAPRRPRLRTRPSLPSPNSDDPYVRGLWALRRLAQLVLDLRALGQRAEALAGDAGEVDERVLAPVIRRDEAEALLVAEPLHDTCSHESTPLGNACVRGAAGTAFPHTTLSPN